MCGIAGFVGGEAPSRDQMEAALDSLHHRGPDDRNMFFSGKADSGFQVALGHTRLSIIDLDDRSNQPFFYEQSALVFNGEIYNYLELKADLTRIGHQFSTQGDTEVLAHALREWGTSALDRCEGMWALAWLDQRANTVFLARDRFGEKPLFIWNTASGWYFASEVKALAKVVGRWPDTNIEHVVRYLVNGYKSLNKSGEGFFKEIEQLKSGSFLAIRPGGVITREDYWQPRIQVTPSLSFDDAVDMVRQDLYRAVELRLRADVAIAFCMSGGIDSNSLISIATRVFEHEVHGFTIMNTDPRYDERALVKLAVSDQSLSHTPVELCQDNFLNDMRAAVTHHDGPVATISYFVHWQLIRAISEAGYRVCISGTGADELFSGYFDHHNMYLAEVSGNRALYQASLEAWKKHQLPNVRNPFLQDPNLFLKNPRFRDHIFLNRDMFSSWMKDPWKEDFKEVDFGAGLLRNRMLNELFYEAVPVILAEDDLNSMSFSIENRSPFLDRNLFETACSIPVEHLVRDGAAKAILRSAMRGIVPDAILDNRQKIGFNAPILDLVDVHQKETRDYLLDDGPIFDIVKRDAIATAIRSETMPNSMSKFLFSFISAKLFLETHYSI
jgi:asparagine synthase (glutamine-hydrolysing)